MSLRPEPYHDRHRATVRAKADRRTPPTRTRDLLRWARREYELDGPPLAIHEGYEHIGEGGAPKIAGGFLHYVTSHPAATDPQDSARYQWPMRRALWRLWTRDVQTGDLATELCVGVFVADSVIEKAYPGMSAHRRDRLVRDVLKELWDVWSAERIEPVKGRSEAQLDAEAVA